MLIKTKKAYNPFALKELRTKGSAACFEEFGQIFYVFAMASKPMLAAPMIASYCIVSVILSRIFLKEKLKCQYTKFIATHEKCNFSRAIYLKESEINDEPLFCECKGCKKKLKYKKEKEELLDYIPNKKIKGYVDVWKRLQ